MKKFGLFVMVVLGLQFLCFSQKNTQGESKCVLITSNQGNLMVKLYDETPKHRDNFIKLVSDGFYDQLLFHRVIPNFMIQGGDPDSRNAKPGQALGSGGPGYTVPAEFNQKFFHKKGALAAARQGDEVNPNRESSGSQFYIVQGKVFSKEEISALKSQRGMVFTPEQEEAYTTVGGSPWLDQQYTVFGEVIEGLNVIDEIAKKPCDRMNRPLEDVMFKMQEVSCPAKLPVKK